MQFEHKHHTRIPCSLQAVDLEVVICVDDKSLPIETKIRTHHTFDEQWPFWSDEILHTRVYA